jgi:putative nucleotidyltransferase with HDIG domain
VIEGLTIRHREDAVARAEKRSTTLELLATSGAVEVSRQRIEAGRHFYLFSSDEWRGFELVYVLKGVLSVDPADNLACESEPTLLQAGDFVYHNGLPRKVFFRVGEEVELLLVTSAPSFDVARDRVDEMVAIAQAVEEKDSATQGHCRRLGHMAIQTGEKMGLRGQTLHDISYAAYLHDIGKVKVPGNILGKEGHLTDEEWEEMKRHPEYGAEILREKEFLSGAAEIVKTHHERYDGSGYPAGLKGDDIPIGARIIAVVDTYDAMTSERPYQQPLSKEEAIAELRAHAGTQFDPEVVEAFIAVLGENGAK